MRKSYLRNSWPSFLDQQIVMLELFEILIERQFCGTCCRHFLIATWESCSLIEAVRGLKSQIDGCLRKRLASPQCHQKSSYIVQERRLFCNVGIWFVARIHISNRLVIPDNYYLVSTIKITFKSGPSDEWGFAQPQNLFKNSSMINTFSLCFDYFSGPLKTFRIMENSKQLLSAMIS